MGALITLLSALTLIFALAYSGRAHALGADTIATSVAVTASPSIIPADGVTMSTITAVVTDANGINVPDGTTVSFTTTLGILSAPSATTTGGKASVTLLSDSADTPGMAAVIAQSGSASGSASVTIAGAGTLTKLSITLPTSCAVSATCAITISATDAFGKPAPDGQMISLNTSDGIVATSPVATNVGTATFSYTAPAAVEPVTVTATAASGLVPAATATLANWGAGRPGLSARADSPGCDRDPDGHVLLQLCGPR